MKSNDIENPDEKRIYNIYRDGFEYVSMEEDGGSIFSDILNCWIMSDTPEKLIQTISKKAFIVMMSATVENDTCINNFDIQFLRENAKYIPIRKEFQMEMEWEYQKKTERNEKEVEHQVSILESERIIHFSYDEREEDDLINVLKMLYEDDMMVEDAFLRARKKRVVNDIECTDGNNSHKYYLNHFLTKIEAIKEFIKDRPLHVMIMFCNALPDKRKMPIELIREFTEDFCRMYGTTYDDSMIQVLRAERDFQNKKEKLRQYMRKHRKLIILTTYNTFGSGQNLTCPFVESEQEKYVRVYETAEERLEADMDAAFFEKKTFILDTKNGEPSNEFKNIYIIESLAQRGEIEWKEKGRILSDIFANRLTLSSIEGTKSFINANVYFLRQAVGRFNRSPYRKPHMRFFISDEYVPYVKACSSSEMWGVEFDSIYKACLDYKKSHHQRTNIERNNRFGMVMSSILKEIEEYRVSGVKGKQFLEYEKVRSTHMLLSMPTISEEEFQKMREEENTIVRYYIRCPKKKCCGYSYDMGDDTDEGVRITDLSFENDCQVEVTEDTIGLASLMQNSAIRTWFKERKYSISWEINEYILMPVIMNNFYKGDLGEAVVEFLDNQYGIFGLMPMEQHFYEMFDYRAGIWSYPVYIDAKLYKAGTDPFLGDLKEKAFIKLAACTKGKAAAIYLNVRPQKKAYSPSLYWCGEKAVLMFPSIFNEEGQIYEGVLDELCEYMREVSERSFGEEVSQEN